MTAPVFAHNGDRLLYRPEEAAAVLAIGRPKLFELIASGEIESFKIGQSRRISRAALERYVRRMETAGPDPPR